VDDVPRGRRIARAAQVLLLLAAVGAAAVLAVRLSSWSNCWRGSITEGREAPAIYGIWRVLHGYPLYEWPTRPPYSLTLYNFGFYRVYALVARLLGADGEGLLGTPRAFTLLGGALGAVVFVRLAARLAPPKDRLGWAALVGFSFTLWFGTQFTSWWSFSLRPDLWAATLALLALSCALPGILERRRALLVTASLIFFVAWTFKQSSVWTFAGSVVGAVLLGELGAALALALPCFVACACALLLGGAAYRFNIVHAPAASAWRLSLLSGVLFRTVPQNLGIFLALPLALGAAKEPIRVTFLKWLPGERLIAVAAAVAVVAGSLALGREGSNKNHLLEGYLLSGLATWCLIQRLPELGSFKAWAPGALLVGLVPYALMPLLQLRRPNALGRIVLCTRQDAAELQALAAAVDRLPKPLYSDDEILSLPWHSSDNRYPALVLDGTWFGLARREGVMSKEFPFDALASGRFGSTLFAAGHPDLETLEQRGVPCAPLGPAPFGIHYVGCTLPRRPPPGR
jgi:hypothetical protein